MSENLSSFNESIEDARQRMVDNARKVGLFEDAETVAAIFTSIAMPDSAVMIMKLWETLGESDSALVGAYLGTVKRNMDAVSNAVNARVN